MWFWRCLLAVWLITALTACGDGGRGLAPVSGTVRYKGAPLANAHVQFVPEEQGARSASGTTDASGHYRLTTFDSYDGARVGKHGVTVAITEEPEKPGMPDGDAPQVGPRPGSHYCGSWDTRALWPRKNRV